jgi:nucleotide-binding universal stress UspA family protein
LTKCAGGSNSTPQSPTCCNGSISELADSYAVRGRETRVSFHLALGDPPTEILRTADAEGRDLIAMTTHGHRLLEDLIYGSTIETVRHRATVPLLVVRATAK